jgi:hypothetical protein
MRTEHIATVTPWGHDYPYFDKPLNEIPDFAAALQALNMPSPEAAPAFPADLNDSMPVTAN